MAVTIINPLYSLRNRVRQYGAVASGRQLLHAAIRRIYRFENHVVFVIPGFSGHEFHDPCIHPLTGERIAKAATTGELTDEEVRLLSGLMAEESQGICAEIDGKLAGYAWVQFAGSYRFGQGGNIELPEPCVVMKNLYVFPEFRGKAWGAKLNRARLSLIAAQKIPVVFIIPENKYAIRNWEQLGFVRVAEVRQWRWLCRPWHMRIRRLSALHEAEPILRALDDAKGS